MGGQQNVFSNIITTAIAVPNNEVSTASLLSTMSEKVSDDLLTSLKQLGVDSRYSIIEDYPHYVTGKTKRKLLSNTTELGAQAVKKCISSANIDPSKICLLISMTNTANRHLPCFGYEVLSKLSRLISTDINVVNMQDQGCSVLLKGIEVAQHYLLAHPDKYVVLVAAESHTGFVPQFLERKYYGFKELGESEGETGKIRDTLTVIESFLFGDGAIALLLGVDPDRSGIDGIAHLTDVERGDLDILHMDEGGILIPAYRGYPHYVMTPAIPERGTFYARKATEILFKHHDALFSNLKDANLYLIHTGSKKILDGVCDGMKVAHDSKKVVYSYDILRDYGNLSSASVGFMIDKCIKEKAKGDGLVISFGVGFSSSNGIIQFR